MGIYVIVDMSVEQQIGSTALTFDQTDNDNFSHMAMLSHPHVHMFDSI